MILCHLERNEWNEYSREIWLNSQNRFLHFARTSLQSKWQKKKNLKMRKERYNKTMNWISQEDHLPSWLYLWTGIPLVEYSARMCGLPRKFSWLWKKQERFEVIKIVKPTRSVKCWIEACIYAIIWIQEWKKLINWKYIDARELSYVFIVPTPTVKKEVRRILDWLSWTVTNQDELEMMQDALKD